MCVKTTPIQYDPFVDYILSIEAYLYLKRNIIICKNVLGSYTNCVNHIQFVPPLSHMDVLLEPRRLCPPQSFGLQLNLKLHIEGELLRNCIQNFKM